MLDAFLLSCWQFLSLPNREWPFRHTLPITRAISSGCRGFLPILHLQRELWGSFLRSPSTILNFNNNGFSHFSFAIVWMSGQADTKALFYIIFCPSAITLQDSSLGFGSVRQNSLLRQRRKAKHEAGIFYRIRTYHDIAPSFAILTLFFLHGPRMEIDVLFYCGSEFARRVIEK